MQHILLLGAGFSRNWGGWLASEAFEYLLGCPEISGNQYLQDLLWKNQIKGGFENALSEVQADFNRDPVPNKKHFDDFQCAVRKMFEDMNKGFFALEPPFLKDIHKVGRFLAKFDAVFTLNQDLWLERYYCENVSSYSEGKWPGGSEMPGILCREVRYEDQQYSWAKFNYAPDSSDFKVTEKSQPYFKLHGSSNWFNTDGGSMLIMGGNKAHEIGLLPVLKWYHEQFEEYLFHFNARLMVIGYGFRDDHINDTITRAVEKNLKMFIIAPEGAELAMRNNSTRGQGMIIAPTKIERTFQQSLIGASRRSLREIFGSDTIEHNKVMRFFQA